MISSSARTIVSVGAVFGAVLTAQAFVPHAAQSPVTTAPQGAPVPVAPAGGRGGGRGNQTAALFTQLCAGCHGTGLEGGRAPTLFDDQWTRATDDQGMSRIIHEGVPGTEMVPFGSSLSDQQIWQLVAYIRTQAATLKGKPTYVPDPDGQVVKSEKQTFKIEILARNIETPWGLAFLPDGRLLVTERPGRIRIVENGKLLPEPVKGTPKVWEKQDGGLLDIEVHPQYSQERVDLYFLRRNAAGICSATARRAAASASCRRPTGPGPRRAARSAVDDRDRARQDQQEQRVDRPAGDLPRRAGSCTARPTRTTDRVSSSTSRGTCSIRLATRTTPPWPRICRAPSARFTG